MPDEIKNQIAVFAQSLDNMGDASECSLYSIKGKILYEKVTGNTAVDIFRRSLYIKKKGPKIFATSEGHVAPSITVYAYRNDYMIELNTGDLDQSNRISSVLWSSSLPRADHSWEKWVEANVEAVKHFCEGTKRHKFDPSFLSQQLLEEVVPRFKKKHIKLWIRRITITFGVLFGIWRLLRRRS